MVLEVILIVAALIVIGLFAAALLHHQYEGDGDYDADDYDHDYYED